MDNNARNSRSTLDCFTSGRRIHPAVAAAAIVVATVLAVTVMLGLDMANYLETSAHLATGDPPSGAQGGARDAGGEHRVAPRVVAAAP